MDRAERAGAEAWLGGAHTFWHARLNGLFGNRTDVFQASAGGEAGWIDALGQGLAGAGGGL
jgi:hypothetical protein